MPLASPFRTSFGTETAKDVVLVRFVGHDGLVGWGECVALAEPTYSSEFSAGAWLALEDHLLPRVVASMAAGRPDAGAVAGLLSGVKGHRMAKAAVEMAVLDAELRASDTRLAQRLGAVRELVDAGVSIGLDEDLDRLVETVTAYLNEGYRRVKLKIEPGWDVQPVAAVREAVGPKVLLQVDANAAYTLEDSEHLSLLDAYELALIEQPLAEDDLAGHAELARRLHTPICLDESITSVAGAGRAIDAGACSVVNLKQGRVGGLLEAVRIHDLCVEAGVSLWCGGMLETGLGRAANVALSALPGFNLPGDLSASARWFPEDLTEPFVLEDGRLRVPTGPGLGVEPLAAVLDAYTTEISQIG